MTTPERLRNRQYREGVALILLGAFSIGFAIYDSHQDQKDDECVAQSFRDLTVALDARSLLAEEQRSLDNRQRTIDQHEAKATRDLILAAITGDYETEKQFEPVQRAYQNALEQVEKDREQLAADQGKLDRDREKTPIPAFPEGTCE